VWRSFRKSFALNDICRSIANKVHPATRSGEGPDELIESPACSDSSAAIQKPELPHVSEAKSS
jgi:hypothetical protein